MKKPASAHLVGVLSTKRVASLLAVGVLGVGLAGCGGSDDKASTSYSEADIIAALNVEAEADGDSWVDAQSGCKVVTALTTKDAVSLYKDAGDSVAAHPSGSAGVKVFAGTSTAADECVRIFEERLAKL